MQSRLESFIEAWVNILIGFSINYVANLIVLPWFGFNVTPGAAFGIGLVFTVISLVRSYGIRRLFVWYGSGGWVDLFKKIHSKLERDTSWSN
jgi:hypothetical protein